MQLQSFSVIVATVGGACVQRGSYQKGSTESEIQQEAQFAANRIGGIIQNAIEVKFESGILKMIKGNVEHAVSLDGTDLKYRGDCDSGRWKPDNKRCTDFGRKYCGICGGRE